MISIDDLNHYDKGQLIELYHTTPFQDSATNTPFDPDVVRFLVKSPAGTTTYIYGTNSNVSKTADGSYVCKIEPEVSGTWFYRVEGESGDPAENRGAHEHAFYVRESEF